MNFLQHEVRIATLLRCFKIPRDVARLRLHNGAVQRGHDD